MLAAWTLDQPHTMTLQVVRQNVPTGWWVSASCLLVVPRIGPVSYTHLTLPTIYSV